MLRCIGLALSRLYGERLSESESRLCRCRAFVTLRSPLDRPLRRPYRRGVDRTDWIEHRRHDGELIGWMRPDGERFVPVDLLGRDLGDAVDWLTAEETLDAAGLAYLAEPYLLRLDNGHDLRVLITEVSTQRIRVKKDDFGAIDAPINNYDLPFPAPVELRVSTRERL
jgi:hypothetical protein